MEIHSLASVVECETLLSGCVRVEGRTCSCVPRFRTNLALTLIGRSDFAAREGFDLGGRSNGEGAHLHPNMQGRTNRRMQLIFWSLLFHV
jgi:hypothetical protein